MNLAGLIVCCAAVLASSPGGAPTDADLKALTGETYQATGSSEFSARYRARQTVLADLERYGWFALWHAASPRLRRDIDALVDGASKSAGTGTTLQVSGASVAASLRSRGKLEMDGAPERACVYVNGVFAGRLPGLSLTLPADTYRVTVAARGRSASREILLEDAKTTAWRVTASDLLPGPEPAAVRGGEIAWSSPIDPGASFALHPVEKGLLVASRTRDGTSFRLYEAASGLLEWEAPLALVPTTPLLDWDGEGFYFVGNDQFLYRLDVSSGKTALVKGMGGAVRLPLLRVGSAIVAAVEKADGAGSVLRAVDPETKVEQWASPRPRRVLSAVTVPGGLFCIEDEGPSKLRLACLDAQKGSERWAREVAGSEVLLEAGGGNPFVWLGDLGFFLDPKTGAEAFRVRFEERATLSDVVIQEGRALFFAADGNLHLYDVATGELLWSRLAPFGAADRTKIVHLTRDHAVLYAASAEDKKRRALTRGLVALLSARTGEVLYTRQGSADESVRWIDDRRVLVTDAQAGCTVRDVERGNTVWEFVSPEEPKGAERLVATSLGRRVYVASTKFGRLFAADLP